MSELETKLNHILEEHQHESGLHMIGGRRRLIDRLVKFFEEDVKPQEKSAPAGSRENEPYTLLLTTQPVASRDGLWFCGHDKIGHDLR